MKALLALCGITRTSLETLVESAIGYARQAEERRHGRTELAGVTVASMFFEPSTRTRLSFELAARRLGADVVDLHSSQTSESKGESFLDTVVTIAAMGADILVIRHPENGMPRLAHEVVGLPVVNAGDGTGEHPTQALVDTVTLVRHFGSLDGLRMAIVGDVRHSRVARSLMHAVPLLGVELILVGPDHLLPEQPAVPTSIALDPVLPEVDVVYLLRVQRERGALVDEDYHRHFGMDRQRTAALGPDAVIMHPGPLNRGVEISDDVADGPRSLIRSQVENGVPTRMSVLAAFAEAGC